MSKHLFEQAFLLGFSIFFGTTVLHAQIPNYVPKDSLTAWWDLNNTLNSSNSEIRYEEECGSKLRFWGYPTECKDRALEFKDSSSFMNIRSTNKWTLKGTTYSLSFWISFKNLRMPLNSSDSLRSILGYRPYLKIRRNKNLDAGTLILYGNTNLRIDTLIINPYQYYHVVIVEQNAISKLYINGKFVGESQQYVSQATGDSSMYFGNSNCWDSKSFNGYLDNIGLWDKALSSQEILELYNGGQCDFRIVEDVKKASVMGDSAFFAIKTNKKAKSYTWQYLNRKTYLYENITDSNVFSGFHSDTLRLKSLDSTWTYALFRCLVEGEDCGCALSDTAGLDFTTNTKHLGKYPITVFPNPTCDGRVNLFSSVAIESIRLFNSLGILIFEENASDLTSIDVNKISAGNYILKIRDAQGQEHFQRLMIQAP